MIAELGLEDNCRRLAMEGWAVVEKGAVPEFNARLRLKILELSRGTAAAIHRIAIPMPTRSLRCAVLIECPAGSRAGFRGFEYDKLRPNFNNSKR